MEDGWLDGNSSLKNAAQAAGLAVTLVTANNPTLYSLKWEARDRLMYSEWHCYCYTSSHGLPEVGEH